MGRNGILDCLRCGCFSSSNNPAPSSFDIYADLSADSPSRDNGPSVANSQHLISIGAERVPPFKLVSLPRHPVFPRHAIGIEDEVNSIIQLLEWENETNLSVAVILHGLGGTGKTTLADAVVATLAHDIQGWTFSILVPAEAETSGCEGEIHKDMFENENAFIYMDNFMVPGEHLHKLLPNNCKKLRLLVTARNEMVADVIAGCAIGIHTHVYPVRPLLSHHAMELLCNKMEESPGTMQLHTLQVQINEILNICDGVPLVLQRVGAYICKCLDKDEAYKRVIQWSKDGNLFTPAEEYSIEKNGLLFDLDELPPSAEEAFLDICSFFNGWDWDKVSSIMGEDELNILRKRALLLNKEECENKVTVRPIVLIIGRSMTKGKRFTSAHDLSKVLEGEEPGDIKGIKGIWLEDNISQPFLLSAKTLDLMHGSLRVLALGDMVIVVDGQCTQKFKQIIYFQAGLIPYIPFDPAILQELRFLDWLPHNNNDLQLAKMSSKLKILNLNGGRYHRPFETAGGFGRLRGLRTLKFAEFKTLKILPEQLSLLTQLEELDLSGCGKLGQLPKGLGDLKALKKLNLRSCGSLQLLPDSFGKLRSLKHLDLRSCVSLEQLPQDLGSLVSLEELDLGSGYLKELPSSFEKLSSLKVLNLMYCGTLKHLPDNMGNLSALVRIEFVGSALVTIPASFQPINSFPVSVSMANCSYLRDLPEEFCGYLKLVKDLSFRRCQMLTYLPKRIVQLTSLARLDLHYCTKLERLPEGFGQLKSLAQLNLKECYSLQQLSTDFHFLSSLQSLNMQWCRKLEGKWMDSVRKIKTLELVDIVGSKMLVKRWAELEMEKGEEPWHFTVRTGRKKWKNVENVANKTASKLLTGECLLTDPRGEPFSLSTVEPNTILLVMYEHRKDSWGGPWRLLEQVVKNEHPLIPFQMIYVGKYFDQLSKSFADGIMACASEESDASCLFYNALQVSQDDSSDFSSNFLVTNIVADEGGHKHFTKWQDITPSTVEFLLSNSTLYSDLQKLTASPVEGSNVSLLRALFVDIAESTRSSIFVRKYTENIEVDQLHGKTVLLLISDMDEHPFESLKEIYWKVQTSDDVEILSIPIPVEVRGRPRERLQHQVAELPDSDLAGFEKILRNVPWPVLRNPWSLKTEVYYFLEREWGELNPGRLVVVDSNGRICNKNALPLVETWGSQVLPFSEENMKRLEQESVEEHVGEYIMDGLLEKWSKYA